MTAITPFGMGMEGRFLDTSKDTELAHAQPTPWFAYQNQTTGCRIARFTTTDTLDTLPCDRIPTMLGRRADGALVAADNTNVYTLTSAGAQRVAATSGSPVTMLDTGVFPPVLVGWRGNLSSSIGYSCLAMQPQRCWTYSIANAWAFTTTASSTANGGVGSFQHIIERISAFGSATVSVIRPVGPGIAMP